MKNVSLGLVRLKAAAKWATSASTLRWIALETGKAEARDIVYTCRKEVDSFGKRQDEKSKLPLAALEEQSREIEELKAAK